MSWTNFTDDHGRPWKVDQIGLWILVRQNLYNRAIQRHSQTVRETHLLLPDRVWVSTDFAAARAERDRESSPTYARLEQETIRDGARALQTLTEMRRQTEDAVDRVRTMQRNASHQTFENIERAVSRAETGREVAVFVRDLAGTTLVVGAGFMTGGAALGAPNRWRALPGPLLLS